MLRLGSLKLICTVNHLKNILLTIKTNINILNSLNHILTPFLDQLKEWLQVYLTVQQNRSLGGSVLENLLEKQILPSADVWLFVVRLKTILSHIANIEKFSDDHKKWKSLETYQENLTREVFQNNNETNVDEVIRLMTSNIRECERQQQNLSSILRIWADFCQNVDVLCVQGIKIGPHVLFQEAVIPNIQQSFQEATENLTVVEFQEKTLQDIDSILNEFKSGKPIKNKTTLCLLESNRLKLTNKLKHLKQEVILENLFNDFKTGFQKDIRVKCAEWAQFLETFKSEIDRKLKNVPCCENKTIRLLSTYDVRQVLQKMVNDWGPNFTGKTIPLGCLLRSLNNLCKNIKTSHPDSEFLQALFTEQETVFSRCFNLIMKIMDHEVSWNQAHLLRDFILKVCKLADKHEAKYLLKCYWFNVRRMIKCFIEGQVGVDVKSLQTFRMSVKEYQLIQNTMIDMAYDELLRQSCINELNYARLNPVSYILQKRTLQKCRFLRARLVRRKSPYMAFLVLVILGVVTFGWSNVKNLVT